MAISKNSFILIDYVIRAKDTGELIETTIEDVAKKENKYEVDRVYEPLLVIVGENRIIRGLEEHIENFGEAEKEMQVEIPPEKAYGVRDSSKVKIVSVRELIRNNIIPEVGKTVELNGQVGVVKAVTGGRVLIDFNHPLAGKTLLCTYKIVKIIEDDSEKIRHLLHRRYRRIPLDRFKVSIDQNTNSVTIEVPKEILLDRDLQLVKAIVAEEIYRFIGKYNTVMYIEKFEKETEKK
ncbi:peptidylprolyl isomerase [Ignisphaera sp. 4213-co]|uniref:peptidylprolyl isomerase n=1 Tax=Ignisphaera cupida TaxID=3050454 RepID=A0ABD4Z4J0_9CREN|nr:peptidylprolyl isomerase [Ignisphaera sp. 4213-co]MDK6027825.1 peptidylprolyl isomerase [Ignisphaera sp. 4213-co]